jgi:23S rRNA (adenine2503-C2)-methyltransferase
MRIISEYGSDNVARVYVAQMREGEGARADSKRFMVEFVESVQPPIPREQKWVLIVSSMFGCPIRCRMCDAGGEFAGRLTVDEILAQIDHMVRLRFPDGRVPTKKFKIQFARMGEPSLNPEVLDAMDRLPQMYDAPGLQASMSTVAPSTKPAREFFEKLIAIKERHYAHGRFQLQFSIHTTDTTKRDELIPTKKWSFEEIAAYGARFARPDDGDKKVTLNFAPAIGYPIDAVLLCEHFDPSLFMIKLTPLNPTVHGHEEALRSAIDPHDSRTSDPMIESLRREGFDVVLSIGELEENRIGSNCGQFIQRALNARERPSESYELDRYRAAENQS